MSNRILSLTIIFFFLATTKLQSILLNYFVKRMFSVRALHIAQVLVNCASLFDHKQRSIYNITLNVSCHLPKKECRNSSLANK
jgi:hypothetical protein